MLPLQLLAYYVADFKGTDVDQPRNLAKSRHRRVAAGGSGVVGAVAAGCSEPAEALPHHALHRASRRLTPSCTDHERIVPTWRRLDPWTNTAPAAGSPSRPSSWVAIQVVLDSLSVLGCSLLFGSPETGASIVTMVATGAAQLLSGALYIAALVVFMVWVYRATSNLQALGSREILCTPSSAVWGFFIPFINLVRPHQVMSQIWIESQPAVLNEHGYALPRKATPVSIWWAAIVLGSVITRVIRALPDPTTIDSLHSVATLGILEGVSWSTAGVLFIYMVWNAQKRQDEQWQDLELRRSVPQPSADALR